MHLFNSGIYEAIYCCEPVWKAVSGFNLQVGNRYAALCGAASAEPSITRFFGVFFMFFQTSQIWGNLISSLSIYLLKINPDFPKKLNLTYPPQFFQLAEEKKHLPRTGSIDAAQVIAMICSALEIVRTLRNLRRSKFIYWRVSYLDLLCLHRL